MRVSIKRPQRWQIFFIGFMIALLSVVIHGCNDHGLDPNFFPKVTGRLVIDGAQPLKTDEITLALGLSTDFLRAVPSGDLSLTAESDTVIFQMEGVIGRFDAIFAIWKELGTPLSIIENMVGASCIDGALTPIEITKDSKQTDTVQVNVSLRKVNRRAKVRGTITFNNDWPDDIDNLALIFTPVSVLFNASGGGLNVCTLLQKMDIRLLPKKPTAKLDFFYHVAPGDSITALVAYNKVGQSLFQPSIISELTFPPTFFRAVADSAAAKTQITATWGQTK